MIVLLALRMSLELKGWVILPYLMVCFFVIITVLTNIEVIQSVSKLKTNNFLCNRQQEMESVTLLREDWKS